jgi:hypothetical protein
MRFGGATARRGALICSLGALRAASAQQIPPEKIQIADAVRADLSALTDLERVYFGAHKRFTDDIKSLNFMPKSGASISVTYASARTFSASALHVRLTPFVCFSIVATPDAASPADKPFCTDSRYGTAASALAHGGARTDSSAPEVPQTEIPKLSTPSVMAITPSAAERPTAAHLTVEQFAERLRGAAAVPSRDTTLVMVQFAVKDARYDPSRGVLEIVLDTVALPMAARQAGDLRPPVPAIACAARPAFVCGQRGLIYIARSLWKLPPAKAPSEAALRSGLTLQASFELRPGTASSNSTLALMALILQSNGQTVSRWDSPDAH